MKAENKTQETSASVEKFLESISDETKRNDCYTILKMMKRSMKVKPKMWGTSIVGFGKVHYKYASGREGDWFRLGFSPRKQALTLYVTGTVSQQQELLKKLGKYKTGKGCLYINKLDDVDIKVLEQIIIAGAKQAKAKK